VYDLLAEKQKSSELLSFPNKNFLSDYVDLIIKANKKFNLISKSTEKDIWERHILDSAQLINFLPYRTKTLCDVGSGAGLPGVVLKIIKMSLNVTIVEPSKRKSDFIKSVSDELGLNLKVIQEKYEDVKVDRKSFPKVITARALKPLDKLIDLFYRDLKLGTICIFPKGESWQSELESAQLKWDFSYSLETSITNKNSKIFIIKDAKRHNE
tara:strand:- start:708 stop:1340 length:633 start_codon:yes stop_codon:yes gene_type:complete